MPLRRRLAICLGIIAYIMRNPVQVASGTYQKKATKPCRLQLVDLEELVLPPSYIYIAEPVLRPALLAADEGLLELRCARACGGAVITSGVTAFLK